MAISPWSNDKQHLRIHHILVNYLAKVLNCTAELGSLVCAEIKHVKHMLPLIPTAAQEARIARKMAGRGFLPSHSRKWERWKWGRLLKICSLTIILKTGTAESSTQYGLLPTATCWRGFQCYKAVTWRFGRERPQRLSHITNLSTNRYRICYLSRILTWTTKNLTMSTDVDFALHVSKISNKTKLPS